MAQKTIGYVHLEWICPNCGTRNQGIQKTCSTCGSPQPQDVVFEEAQKQELIQDEALKETAKKGPDIHCPYCNARNASDAKVCVQCGGDLTGGVRREAGRVIGAFSTQAKPIQQIACPHCGAPNPDTNKTCEKCGGNLAVPPAMESAGGEPAAAPITKGKPLFAAGCGIAALIGIGLTSIVIIVLIILALTKKEVVSGTVQNTTWERIVEIQALADVSRSDWKDEIPADARVGDCVDKLHHEQDSPAPQSTEVCGTPYTVDTGSGVGEVVQDCVYQVYAEYCDYTVKDWKTVDQVSLNGTDMNPVWPEPDLASDQREGDRIERYTIFFATSDGILKYVTSDYRLFLQCKPGSEWILSINTFGDIVDLEPK